MIGYHASSEQFSPRQLLKLAKLAGDSGFEAISFSDHFSPWTRAQGHSSHSWSWLGAAMASTELEFLSVCAPGQRYHPAIVAQACATLDILFPGRYKIALGSGQLLNEKITGTAWPAKRDRNQRLAECARIMRELWQGHEVNFDGLVSVESARLYSLGHNPVTIIGAALTAETARWLGGWADGLMTISASAEQQQKVVDAFRQGGGEDKPMYLKVQLCYARTFEQALEQAHQQWSANVFESRILSELADCGQFESAAKMVTPEQMTQHVRVSENIEKQLEWIRCDFDMGFERVYLHNVGLEQEQFIEAFGPRLGSVA